MNRRYWNIWRVVIIAAGLVYVVIHLSKIVTTNHEIQIEVRRKLQGSRTLNGASSRRDKDRTTSLKKAAGVYTDVLTLDMYVPPEIMQCVNKTVHEPYTFNYDTEFYLIPPLSELCRMTLPDLELLYQRYLSTIQTVCKMSRRFGKITDGGWDACVEQEYLPRTNCLVYSFGINHDFSFDDDIAKFFDCEVHSFDPSMETKSHRRSEKVYFHDFGISDVSRTDTVGNEWKMKTFTDLRNELRHKERIADIVKMDIEAWEWNVLPDMFTSGHFPKQLIIEVHVWSAEFTTQKELWIRRLSVLRDLYDAGYRIFWLNRNLLCKYESLYTKEQTLACHEISLLRVGPDIRNSIV